VVERVDKYDANPANNPQPPAGFQTERRKVRVSQLADRFV
jgi:hypothetical protein